MYIIDPKISNFKGFETDINVNVTLNLQATICLRFIMQIKDFAMSQIPIFDRPKKQELGAIKAKIEKVKDEEINTITDFSKTSFMKLNVDLATPILLIPLNDQSDEMLRMDFGHIAVKNGYRHGEISKNERISKKISY